MGRVKSEDVQTIKIENTTFFQFYFKARYEFNETIITKKFTF